LLRAGLVEEKRDVFPHIFLYTVNAAKKRKFNVLLVWKLDRLSRLLKNLINTLDELGSLSIDFVSYDNNVDTFAPTGKLVL
jgi:DNA invertase Pin-like site-specific DNA recombinase